MSVAAKTVPITRTRWLLATLFFILTAINFADRGVLGAVAPLLMKSLNLSVAQFGIVASGFGWGYCLMVFLSGGIVTALGPRRTYAWLVTLWSLIIMATAFAGNFLGLLLLRILFGASEGAVFPAGSQLIGKWLPPAERGMASGLLIAGIPLGSFLVVPLAVWLGHTYGWQAPFIVLGIIGFIWVLGGLWFITDTPRDNAHVSPSELNLIEKTISPSSVSQPGAPVPWDRILRSRTLWLTGLAFFSSAYVLYFMLAFFPTYLVKQRHVEYTSIALLGSVPWIVMLIGGLASGYISDRLYKWSAGNLRIARSYFAGGALIATGILVAWSTMLTDTSAIVVVLSVASGINFLANPMFIAIPLDAAPEHGAPVSALTTGLGSLAAIVAPLITGFLVQASGTFYVAFTVVAALPIIFGVLLIAACHPDRL